MSIGSESRFYGSLMAAIALFAVAFASPSQGQELPDANELLTSVNGRDDGTSLKRTIHIALVDKRGKSREQTAVAFRKYYDGEKHSAIFYVEPANIKDTAFLTYDYYGSGKDDDQWLYLPELRRVRRISSSNRGDYYLGTDFTYEDIKLDTRLSVTDYNWNTVGLEDVDGHPCYIVEGIPVDTKTAEELGYGKFKAFVDSETYFVRKNEVFDINGNALKTVLWEGWKQVDGIWTVSTMSAENHKTDHKTVFTFTDVDYETDIPDDTFTERSLARGYSQR